MRFKKFFLITLSVCLLFTISGKLFAEDGDDSINSLQKFYKKELEENNTFEDFMGDFNPYLREMYGGYQRDGNFMFYDSSEKKVYTATRIECRWENGVTQYYKVNGQLKRKEGGDIVREVITYHEQNFILKVKAIGYKEPFDTMPNGEKIAAGTYRTTRASGDFIELKLANGKKVWVNPQYNPEFSTTNNGYYEESVEYLSVNNINGVAIKKSIMPVRDYARTGIKMKPQYVTIHNTGNSDKGANAEAHANGQKSYSYENSPKSWHFTVDNKEIYQSMPMNEIGWHAGDGLLMGNVGTIGIEICENSDGNYATGEKTATMLTARILYENGLPADAVRMHHDWSGKDCAYNILHNKKQSMGWQKFKETVKTEYDKIVKENTVPDVEISSEISDELKNELEKNKITFDQGYLYGFAEGSDIAAIGNDLTSLGSVEIKGSDGKIITSAKVSSGQVITVAVKTDVNVITYQMVVILRGDINGDGKISAMDYVKIRNKLDGKKGLNAQETKAADVNKDGRVSAIDYVRIRNKLDGKITISQ